VTTARVADAGSKPIWFMWIEADGTSAAMAGTSTVKVSAPMIAVAERMIMGVFQSKKNPLRLREGGW